MTSPADSSLPELRIYGNLTLLEMAPLLLAADQIYPGKAAIEHGGVATLWGKETDLPSLAAAGHSDIAANSEIQALRAAAGADDLRFVFTLAECSYRIVGRRSAGIAQLQDLRAKRIGTMPNSSAEYFLERMLAEVGLGAMDATIVPYMANSPAPLTLMPNALRDGQLDAVTVWEPQIERARLAIGDDAIELSDPSIYRERFCLCTTQAKLGDPELRRAIVAFVRALIAATERLQREPRYAQALVAQTSGLELSVVESSWPYLTFPGALPGDLLDALVPAELWVARRSGRRARSRGELSALIDDTIVRDALLL